MMNEYQEFLKQKVVHIKEYGFDVTADQIHPMLFDWQNEIVRWACKIGCAALFEECGLGKTLQQIEWARLVVENLKSTAAKCMKALIVAPLAVAHQTIAEGVKVGVRIVYIRHQEEVSFHPDIDIFITNYDMLKEIDGQQWGAVVLDESSILKSFTGATKRLILDMFEFVPYKLACTATPAPNDHLELGNHAQFLGMMQSNEMIQRWFINDSMHAGNYRLKHHAEKDYWRWVTSWAVCISKPSDLGYPNDGFDIPELVMHDICVGVDHTRAFVNGELILAGAISATEMWREKKATLLDRCEKAKEIVDGNLSDTWIIWCDTNSEADELMLLFPEAIEVRGDQSIAEKERKLTSFTDGASKMIITKADIAGFGLNWQHCHNQIFVGVTYSFEKTYQALRRSWRFGQKNVVNAWMIYAETEGNIMKTLSDKQESHKVMQHSMNEAMTENGLGQKDPRAARFDIITGIKESESWSMLLGDACQEIKKIPDNSIDFSIYSPPFSNLYIYSDYVADMGNSADDEEFFKHYLFLIKDIYRVIKPGRLCAVHCKDLPLYMNRDGAAGLSDFPGRIVRAHEEAGFTYHSRVTIWKDPVIEMQRTKNHGLLHKNWTERSEVVRQGMPDYMVVFRKFLGLEDVPDKQVTHHVTAKEHIFRGDNPPTNYDSDRDYSIQVWQRYASPVWFDINQTRVLNAQLGREGNDEKHICPLQLDVIDRSIYIWTNPGDVVLSPFAGIGSEGVEAIKMGRKFIGIELKESYFKIAVKNLTAAEEEKNTPTLFDDAY